MNSKTSLDAQLSEQFRVVFGLKVTSPFGDLKSTGGYPVEFSVKAYEKEVVKKLVETSGRFGTLDGY